MKKTKLVSPINKEPEPMIIFKCPYCGNFGVISKFLVVDKNVWECFYCHHKMTIDKDYK